MTVLLVSLAIILVVPFALVLLRGAPYLPTKKKQINTALDLLGLKPGELLLDLGCGDGTVLVKAGERGLTAIGYELNPFLVLVAKWRTRKYKDVSVRFADMWAKPLPPETKGIFVFLIDNFMQKLNSKIIAEKPKHKLKLASYSFVIENKKPAKTVENINLYVY